MAVQIQIKILGVGCDKPRCGEVLHVPSYRQDVAEYQKEFRLFLRRHQWTIWVGRGRRYYCPEHGPSQGSTMRQVT